MRSVAEKQVWSQLNNARRDEEVLEVPIGSPGASLALPGPCTVIAGLNGAGKTRALRGFEEFLGEKAILIRLHELCEHARANLRARNDIAEMAEETGPLTLDPLTLNHLGRIIGRDYDYVEWYALDFEPSPDYVASFKWQEDQINVPHFRVMHKGIEYSSLEMGLGEFSVHLLFWIMSQHREPGLFLLLDEPDAFLPPVTAERLLHRLLKVIQTNDWRLVVATHSQSMIEAACENDAFVLLRHGIEGAEAHSSSDLGPSIADELLPARPINSILFCEDEAAAALVRAILASDSVWRVASTSVIWKNGEGYLRVLAQHLPRYHGMKISMALVFDGDQRASVNNAEVETKWPSVFLPSDQAPDALFRQLAADAPALAQALGKPDAVVNAALDALEGADDHDWVNGLCERLGVRTHVLDVLATIWVERHLSEANEFLGGIP